MSSDFQQTQESYLTKHALGVTEDGLFLSERVEFSQLVNNGELVPLHDKCSCLWEKAGRFSPSLLSRGEKSKPQRNLSILTCYIAVGPDPPPAAPPTCRWHWTRAPTGDKQLISAHPPSFPIQLCIPFHTRVVGISQNEAYSGLRGLI